MTANPGGTLLLAGVDQSRDQSYFLFGLTQEQLARTMFPLGSMAKAEVRILARNLGLGVAGKAESREICFVPNGDYASFVEAYREQSAGLGKAEPGEIVSEDGAVLGEHGGVHNFTVGQRRGLGIAVGQPIYVTEIQATDRKVVVGPKEALLREGCRIREPNWIRFDALREPLRAQAKIRYRAPLAWAEVRPVAGMPDQAEVVFDEPQYAVTPGQAAVFYADDCVLGGGWIV